MRASKLITVSTMAVLLGGTSLAIGLESAGSLQGGSSMQEGSTTSQGGVRGSETKGPRAAENPMRRSEISGQRGSNVQGSRELQRGQAMTGERGGATAGERGPAKSAERGQAIPGERSHATAERSRPNAGARALATPTERRQATTRQGAKAGEQLQGQQPRQSFGQMETGQAYGRTSERNAGAGLNAQQRERLREILSARRDIPRVSNLRDVRVNAVIPRGVRMAAIPEEVVRMYPRFRRHEAFIYRNEIVVVDPATLRIVAVLPA